MSTHDRSVIAHFFGGPKDGEEKVYLRAERFIEFTAPRYRASEPGREFVLDAIVTHTYELGEEFEAGEVHVEYGYVGSSEKAVKK